MSLQKLMNQPLTIQTVSGTTIDAYGNTIPGPLGPPTATVGYLELKETIEYLLDRETVVSKWKVFLPANTVVAYRDFVTFQAQKFEIDGEPWHVYNPRTQQVSHLEANLTVVS